MTGDIDFKKWDVPALSDEKIDGILATAGRRLKRRRFRRTAVKSALLGIVLIAAGAVLYQNYHLRSELRDLRALLTQDINEAQKVFFIEGGNLKEDRHEDHF